jgi:hypothetical protein
MHFLEYWMQLILSAGVSPVILLPGRETAAKKLIRER